MIRQHRTAVGTDYCQSCRAIDFKQLFRTKNSPAPNFSLSGKFVAYLPEEPSSDCSMCRLFLINRVPVSDFEDCVNPQGAALQYHLRAYSALKSSRDVNYASLPASLRGRDNVFFAVVPDHVFQDSAQEGSKYSSLSERRSAQVVENHGWRNGWICGSSSRHAGHGFFKGRIVQSSLDYSILRRWLDLCCRYHQECRLWKYQTRDIRSVKVIYCPAPSALDLSSPLPTVILKPPKCDYVALSYVWGRPTKSCPETTKVRINGTTVPQVVLDAITITQKLGLKYLWVDK